MMIAVSVIETALPVFLAIALGMLCRSKGFLTRDGVDTLKKVIVNITLPFVLFNAFATAEYTLAALILPLVMFAVCCLALVHLCLISYHSPPFSTHFSHSGLFTGP